MTDSRRLWEVVEGVPHPLATRCTACGRTSFPIAERCRFCGSDAVDVVRLSSPCTVVALSVMDGNAVAHVQTAEGVLLLGQVEPAKRIEVGSRVRFAPAGPHMRFKLDE